MAHFFHLSEISIFFFLPPHDPWSRIAMKGCFPVAWGCGVAGPGPPRWPHSTPAGAMASLLLERKSSSGATIEYLTKTGFLGWFSLSWSAPELVPAEEPDPQ